MSGFVSFDDIWPRMEKTLAASALVSRGFSPLWVVRDLMGRIRLLLPEQPEPTAALQQALRELVESLHHELGAHAHEPEGAVLTVDDGELDALKNGALCHRVQDTKVYLVDRLITGSEWGTISPDSSPTNALRFTLFSIKGGVGRSTTAAVLASHLAQQGHRVLLMDLDLESPGLSSMLMTREEYPDFGIVDWFVEDLVGQGDEVVDRMIGRPNWGQDFRGEILVVPAYGSQPEEYLAKLGRVYLDRPRDGVGQSPERWTMRLLRLLNAIETRQRPDVVLLDSRSGLHDLAAAAVTDVGAHVLLFAVDSEATWTGYRVLFRHWRAYGLAQTIRKHLSPIAALVPAELRQEAYLSRLRERLWDLFRECLYDEVPADSVEEAEDELFSFDLAEEGAPHHPVPIYWNPGLAALSSLRKVEGSVLSVAYDDFLTRLDLLLQALVEERR